MVLGRHKNTRNKHGLSTSWRPVRTALPYQTFSPHQDMASRDLPAVPYHFYMDCVCFSCFEMGELKVQANA